MLSYIISTTTTITTPTLPSPTTIPTTTPTHPIPNATTLLALTHLVCLQTDRCKIDTKLYKGQ